MKISSTRKPVIPQTSKPTLTESPKEPQSTPTYFDNFKSTAGSEIPRAMTYSAVAGAALGVATSLLGASPFTSVAQTVAVAAAGGAGVGLASGLLFSAFSAEGTSPAPQPQDPVRQEPVLPKPVVSPEVVFAKDMQTTKSILDRRLDALDSLLQAEQHRHDSLGRSGLKAFDQARKLFGIAKKDLQENAKERPDVVGLKKELNSVKARLRELRADQQQVLNIRTKSDKLNKDSLNRSGRHSRDGAQEVAKELEAEVKRLQKALAQSSLPA